MRSLVEFRQAMFVGLIFAGLGVPLNRQIFGTPAPAQRHVAHISQNVTDSPRPIASEATQAVFHFHCRRDAEKSFETPSSFIRVVGNDCALHKDSSEFSIRHIEDKAEAQILWLDSKRFSTDLIRLKKGENWVEIAYLEDGKRKSHRLKIINSSRTSQPE